MRCIHPPPHTPGNESGPGPAHLITVIRCACSHRADKDAMELTVPDNGVSAAHTQPGQKAGPEGQQGQLCGPAIACVSRCPWAAVGCRWRRTGPPAARPACTPLALPTRNHPASRAACARTRLVQLVGRCGEATWRLFATATASSTIPCCNRWKQFNKWTGDQSVTARVSSN